jgi:S-methylmethionine-dependent homocysteine/selenocysteine methylase
MPRHRDALPQLGTELFITDGGIETTLIYHHGIELPSFAAFVLLERYEGQFELTRYFQQYARLAVEHGTGLLLESPTWRASRDWGHRLGYSPRNLAELNREAIGLLAEIRSVQPASNRAIVVSGNIGPRGDGYVPDTCMSAEEAEDYHAEQVNTFAATDADLVSAFTINYTEEAIGIARAARAARIPVVISFTVETHGRLPTGETLESAINRTDDATGGTPAYYMINCAHPEHFADTLTPGAAWVARIRGIRANASRLSHAELNESTTLDEGDPEELGLHYGRLRQLLPNLSVIGGCCGTDHRHVDAMVRGVRQGAQHPALGRRLSGLGVWRSSGEQRPRLGQRRSA